MAGAELGFLPGPAQVGGIERLTHLLATVTIHDADVPGTELARGVDHMPQQGLSRQRMQDLGQVGMHPLALARGENDDVQRALTGAA